ncbi:unnamed protein product [Schistocephalus solidus]|uniref:Secreted protein n=1 Tax=Schistocephalus solidus TaxID=70667 RepID=A0A183TKV1_SCHSO|nr:unnamed protein product [Schistocephalus solidus]
MTSRSSVAVLTLLRLWTIVSGCSVGGLRNQQSEYRASFSGYSTMPFAISKILFSFNSERTDDACEGFARLASLTFTLTASSNALGSQLRC